MRRAAQRAVKALYSATAARLYEPLVVRGAMPITAGDMGSFLRAQSRRATAAAAGRPILDLPVGTAYFTAGVAAEHPGVTVGADIAAGMVEQAARRGRAADLRLLVVQADVHDLPFRDATFGAALCHNGLQVIPDLSGALAEFARVLAPEGMLFASVIHAPLGALLPAGTTRRLPTLLRTGADVAREFERRGLHVVAYRRSRLAYFIEAVKRAPRLR